MCPTYIQNARVRRYLHDHELYKELALVTIQDSLIQPIIITIIITIIAVSRFLLYHNDFEQACRTGRHGGNRLRRAIQHHHALN